MSDLCFIREVRQFTLSSETVNIRLGPLIRILVEITNQDNIGEALRAKGQRVPNAPCHHYRSPGVHVGCGLSPLQGHSNGSIGNKDSRRPCF